MVADGGPVVGQFDPVEGERELVVPEGPWCRTVGVEVCGGSCLVRAVALASATHNPLGAENEVVTLITRFLSEHRDSLDRSIESIKLTERTIERMVQRESGGSCVHSVVIPLVDISVSPAVHALQSQPDVVEQVFSQSSQ